MSSIYKKQCRGSITVEASLVTPLFLFAVIAFLYFFQVLIVQEQIQESMTRVSKLASEYGYVYDYISEPSEDVKTEDVSYGKQLVQGFVDGTLFRTKFLEYMGDDVNDHCILGGIDAISFLESSFMKNDKDIEVVAIYTIKIPVPFLEISPFTVVQRVKSRAFVGVSLVEDGDGTESTSEDSDTYVYITRTGTVYHTDYNCTYLNVKVTKIQGSELATKRNSSGAIYYPCEACMSGEYETDKSYYITEYGTRYHSSESCNKIERDIQKIKLSEVGSRKPCSKCGK